MLDGEALVAEREEERKKKRKRLRRKGKRKKGARKRSRTTIGKWKRNDPERRSGRAGTEEWESRDERPDIVIDPFHPLPIRHHPVMELQIRRHYMPLGNLWFRAQFHASTRPVTSLQPPLIPLTTLSPSLSLLLSLFLAFRHSNRSTLPSILSACSIHAEHKSQGLELILLTLAWTRAVKRKEEERPRCSSPPFDVVMGERRSCGAETLGDLRGLWVSEHDGNPRN